MPLADSSILVTPGTGATVATEVISGKHYLPFVLSDTAGQIIGRRDTYVVSDRRQPGAANAWYLSLYNDTTSTFVEVVKVTVTLSTSVAITARHRLIYLHRITIKSGGSNSTAVAFDTASPALPPRIKAARRPTSATVSSTPLSIAVIDPRETGHPQMVTLFDAKGGEPILLRSQQGVGIQQDATSLGTLVNTMIQFRVRT